MGWKRSTILLLTAAAFAAPVVAQQSEEAGVRAALQHYLDGQKSGKGDDFRAAFDVRGTMWVPRADTAVLVPFEHYIANADKNYTGKPSPDEPKMHRRIVSIDITGATAIAKIELDGPEALMTDYMSLLRIRGEWRIVNKIVNVERRTRPDGR